MEIEGSLIINFTVRVFSEKKNEKIYPMKRQTLLHVLWNINGNSKAIVVYISCRDFV